MVAIFWSSDHLLFRHFTVPSRLPVDGANDWWVWRLWPGRLLSSFKRHGCCWPWDLKQAKRKAGSSRLILEDHVAQPRDTWQSPGRWHPLRWPTQRKQQGPYVWGGTAAGSNSRAVATLAAGLSAALSITCGSVWDGLTKSGDIQSHSPNPCSLLYHIWEWAACWSVSGVHHRKITVTCC